MKSVSLSITDSLRTVPSTEWDALVGDAPLLSHAFPPCAARNRLRRARDRLDATLYRRIARPDAWSARCRSTSRHTRTANTSSTGRGPTRIGATAAATTRSCCAAIPFTPATGPRLIIADRRGGAPALLDAARALLTDERLSSLHILFPDASRPTSARPPDSDAKQRAVSLDAIAGYRDFEDFLATLNHGKRARTSDRSGASSPSAGSRSGASPAATSANMTGDFFIGCYRIPIAIIIPRRICR